MDMDNTVVIAGIGDKGKGDGGGGGGYWGKW